MLLNDRSEKYYSLCYNSDIMSINENEKRLIAIDLDGTTLKSDGRTISDYTKQVFTAVEAMGHIIIIATGRPYRMSIDIYTALGLTSPMVNFNGALTSLPNDKAWPYALRRYIDRNFVFDLLRHQQTFDLEFIAAEYRRKFFLNNFQAANPEVFSVERFKPYNRLRPDKLTNDPYALLLSTRAHDKITIQNKIQTHFHHEVSVSAWGGPNGILEIVPRGINKAYGLKHLLKTFHMQREQLIAFGDEYNDIEMFQLAQTSYAVKNVSARLVGHADEVLSWTNDEDGVARKLEELFL